MRQWTYRISTESRKWILIAIRIRSWFLCSYCSHFLSTRSSRVVEEANYIIRAGIAIGIISGVVKTISIMIAVIAHKWAEGLALGIQLKASTLDEKT
jgi:hypothetical protein